MPEPNSSLETIRASDIARGVTRLLSELGYAAIQEFTLGSGRRADIAALDSKGRILIVEIKSSLNDYRTDQKWRTYLDFCDAFAFAVAPHFPADVLPPEVGLIIADRYGGHLQRPLFTQELHQSRRRAETIRFARHAAQRLAQMLDARAGFSEDAAIYSAFSDEPPPESNDH